MRFLVDEAEDGAAKRVDGGARKGRVADGIVEVSRTVRVFGIRGLEERGAKVS